MENDPNVQHRFESLGSKTKSLRAIFPRAKRLNSAPHLPALILEGYCSMSSLIVTVKCDGFSTEMTVFNSTPY